MSLCNRISIYVPDINHIVTASMTPRQNFMSVESGMAGTYRGRSRHRLPRREGARSAGRTGGAPQYVPAQKCSAKYGNALKCKHHTESHGNAWKCSPLPNAPNRPDVLNITRKYTESHGNAQHYNIAPKCLDMLAIAQRTGTTPNRPEASPSHRNHVRTAPALHQNRPEVIPGS